MTFQRNKWHNETNMIAICFIPNKSLNHHHHHDHGNSDTSGPVPQYMLYRSFIIPCPGAKGSAAVLPPSLRDPRGCLWRSSSELAPRRRSRRSFAGHLGPWRADLRQKKQRDLVDLLMVEPVGYENDYSLLI